MFFDLCRSSAFESLTSLNKTILHAASLAQMVERKTLNLVVVGSIPTGGVIHFGVNVYYHVLCILNR